MICTLRCMGVSFDLSAVKFQEFMMIVPLVEFISVDCLALDKFWL